MDTGLNYPTTSDWLRAQEAHDRFDERRARRRDEAFEYRCELCGGTPDTCICFDSEEEVKGGE